MPNLFGDDSKYLVSAAPPQAQTTDHSVSGQSAVAAQGERAIDSAHAASTKGPLTVPLLLERGWSVHFDAFWTGYRVLSQGWRISGYGAHRLPIHYSGRDAKLISHLLPFITEVTKASHESLYAQKTEIFRFRRENLNSLIWIIPETPVLGIYSHKPY